MPFFDLTEFFKLSSALNYNLSAASLNRYNVLMYIIGNKRLDDDDKKDREQKGIVMEALGYLFSVYSQKRRRLGPMAVLHPLRAAALFTRSLNRLNLVDLLTLLFHDILEDIKPADYDLQQWKSMEDQLYSLLGRMENEDESRLVTRLMSLTRIENESYYHYIGRLLGDEDLRTAMGLSGKTVSQDYSLEKMVQKIDALYITFLQKKGCMIDN